MLHFRSHIIFRVLFWVLLVILCPAMYCLASYIIIAEKLGCSNTQSGAYMQGIFVTSVLLGWWPSIDESSISIYSITMPVLNNWNMWQIWQILFWYIKASTNERDRYNNCITQLVFTISCVLFSWFNNTLYIIISVGFTSWCGKCLFLFSGV